MDREHQEWLENKKGREAAKKNAVKKTPLPKKTEDDKKPESGDDDGEHIWRGEY